MNQAAQILEYEDAVAFTPLVASPTTVGELRTLLADLPSNVRLFDDASDPPVFVLHYQGGRCRYVEVG